MEVKPLLLHCCCGPCSTSSIKRLLELGFEIHLYFGNSNIFPQQEEEKRFKALQSVASHYNLPLTRNSYDHPKWREHISGYEEEKEGSRRCELCFEYNLEEASRVALSMNIPYFTTTLSVSPHKNSLRIFTIGSSFSHFIPIDFKKKGGFAESVKIAKSLNLYRQDYCGCEFS